MTIHLSAFLIVLILGVAAIVIAVARENPMTSTFWYYTAYWAGLLAFLYPGFS